MGKKELDQRVVDEIAWLFIDYQGDSYILPENRMRLIVRNEQVKPAIARPTSSRLH